MRESDAKATTDEVRSQDNAETFELQQLRVVEKLGKNEGRLDGLDSKVDEGIKRLDREHKDLASEVRAGFEKVDQRFEKVNDEFKAIRGELTSGFDRMQWTLVGAAISIIVALIAAPHI
jgi:hypothetical protein